MALPLLAMGVVKEGTQGKEEGDPLLHLLLHPILQAMMQVHKKLAPLNHPKGEEGIDVCIPLGKELVVSKSSKNITFLNFDGTYGDTNKVLHFIQQFDAAFGGEH